MQIEFRHVSLRLGANQVFSDLDLTVPAGEKWLLRGPSGSGKSTLLRMIPGFVQPDAGSLWIDGQELNRDNVWSLRHRMAYVAQDVQIGTGTVEQLIRDILGYRANRHLTYRETEVLDHFRRFDLTAAHLRQPIRHLSGGERQRLAIIIALLLDRELYLLDEVTSAMDADLRGKVIQYLGSLENKTMLVVSHDPGWEQEGFRVWPINQMQRP